MTLLPAAAAASSLEEAVRASGAAQDQASPVPRPARVTAQPPAPLVTTRDICGADPSGLSDLRDRRREANLRALYPELRPAFKAIVEKYALPPLQDGDFIAPAINSVSYTYSYQLDKAKAPLAAFAEAIEAAVLKRMPLPDYGRVRAALIARVRSSSLTGAAKAELVARLEVTSLILPSEYIRRYIMSTEELWPVMPLLTAEQAWNASYDDLGGASNPNLRPDQSVLIVYPGLLLAELRGDGSRARLDFVLLHEAAHSIDSGRFPSMYGEFAACMKAAYGTQFKNWDEVMADYWAVSALPAFMPRTGGLDYLSKSYELLCGTEGEAGSLLSVVTTADHPAARYRIENILGRDPGVLRALGLPAQAAGCGL